MLSLSTLTELGLRAADAVAHPIAPVRIGGRELDLDAEPLVMGVVNLSRDSTYRDSVAVSTASAVRRARIMHAQGAGLVDLGAESSTPRAARVGDDAQIRALVPVVEALAADGVPTSVEAYSPAVVRACLDAGAAVVNLTGSVGVGPILDEAAAHGAAVVLCFLPGATARDIGDAVRDGDPIPVLADHFAGRLAQARTHGVDQAIIDPGLGFSYGNLATPQARARHQARMLLESVRLRTLGVPLCQALPHAFDLFEEEFRTAEGFFAVLARLGGAHVLRTHEVPRVVAVLRAMADLG